MPSESGSSGLQFMSSSLSGFYLQQKDLGGEASSRRDASKRRRVARTLSPPTRDVSNSVFFFSAMGRTAATESVCLFVHFSL